MTVLIILAIAAFICTILAAVKQATYPWGWCIPVLLICVYMLVQQLPKGQ